jgi:hypothetical protein
MIAHDRVGRLDIGSLLQLPRLGRRSGLSARGWRAAGKKHNSKQNQANPHLHIAVASNQDGRVVRRIIPRRVSPRERRANVFSKSSRAPQGRPRLHTAPNRTLEWISFSYRLLL